MGDDASKIHVFLVDVVPFESHLQLEYWCISQQPSGTLLSSADESNIVDESERCICGRIFQLGAG